MKQVAEQNEAQELLLAVSQQILRLGLRQPTLQLVVAGTCDSNRFQLCMLVEGGVKQHQPFIEVWHCFHDELLQTNRPRAGTHKKQMTKSTMMFH
jgi:hypothetical protein